VVVSHVIFPSAIASSTKYSVIIFVILAGGSLISEFFSNKIFPVFASTIIADSASTLNVGCACTVICGTKSIIIVMIDRKLIINFFIFVTFLAFAKLFALQYFIIA